MTYQWRCRATHIPGNTKEIRCHILSNCHCIQTLHAFKLWLQCKSLINTRSLCAHYADRPDSWECFPPIVLYSVCLCIFFFFWWSASGYNIGFISLFITQYPQKCYYGAVREDQVINVASSSLWCAGKNLNAPFAFIPHSSLLCLQPFFPFAS